MVNRPKMVDPKPVRVGCNTCGQRSGYRRMDSTYDLVSEHGWATCTACAVTVDPNHPDKPPVVPFEAEP